MHQEVNGCQSPGCAVGLLGAAGDIIEQRRVEDTLRESGAPCRALLESLSEMILVWAPDGRILFSNPAASRLLGYSAGELASMQVLNLHLAESQEEAQAIFEAIVSGERDSCPLPLMHKDGSRYLSRPAYGRVGGTV